MTWSVLPVALGFCLLFFCHGEENESHTELQRAKLVPVSTTGPKPMLHNEAAVLGLELKYQNPDLMLMNYRLRLRRRAEKKKKKHHAGAFSPLSMSQDGKKPPTSNSRSKRQGNSNIKKNKLPKHPKPRHEKTSPTEKTKVPERKQVKKPQPPEIFSVLHYRTQDMERSGGQTEDLDD